MAPATTIAILFIIEALLKALSSFESPFSPSILTNPPRGIKRSAYNVSFPLNSIILGPNPIAN